MTHDPPTLPIHHHHHHRHQSHSKLSAKLNGSGYVLGPLTGDHFYVYVADKCVRPSYECHDRVLNIMVRPVSPPLCPALPFPVSSFLCRLDLSPL